MKKQIFKMIIAGSRGFVQFPMMVKKMNHYLKPLKDKRVIIVSGNARGADRLGEEYGKLAKLTVLKYPADWQRDGARAGYLRNTKMAEVSDGLVAFWDGKSNGTLHMIKTMQAHGKPCAVVRYDKINNEEDNKMKDLGKVTMYTDGSFTLDQPDNCGWGYVMRVNDMDTVRTNGVTPNKPNSKNAAWYAEMYAVTMAVLEAKKTGYTHITIKHDNNGVAAWANGTWKTKNEWTKKYAAWVKNMRAKVTIEFVKISGDNNPADKLATAALGIESSH